MAANTAKTETSNTVTVELNAMDVVLIREALSLLISTRIQLAEKSMAKRDYRLADARRRSVDKAVDLTSRLPGTTGTSLDFVFFTGRS